MKTLWSRIESSLAELAPGQLPKLRPAASQGEIADAERTIGVSLPLDFRESLRVHDGQEANPTVLWLPGVAGMGSLASILACCKQDQESYEADAEAEEWFDEGKRVRQVFNHPRHIPIAGSTHWDYDRLLLDLDPGPEGTVGQVIVRRDIEFVYLCSSWHSLLERTASGLESGTIVPVEAASGPSGWVQMEYRRPRSGKKVHFLEYFR